MPFSQTTPEHTEHYWTRHFERFLKPLIGDAGFEASRSRALRGDILREIIAALVTAPVVLADLTDLNANVFWELGVRQSFRHGTVTIAEAGTKLPFDLGPKGTLFYFPKDHLEISEFHRQLKEVFRDCSTNPDRPDSHVLESISGRGSLFEIFRRDEAIRRVDSLLSELRKNEGVLTYSVDTANRNRKNPEERTFVEERFRLLATELLITQRYLDDDDQFFDDAENYFNELAIINEKLTLWEEIPEEIDEWLLEQTKTNPTTESILRNFRQKVEAARRKLGERL